MPKQARILPYVPRQNWKRLTVNLDQALAEAAQAKAALRRQSFAAYVATLIEADLRRGSDDGYELADVPKPPPAPIAQKKHG